MDNAKYKVRASMWVVLGLWVLLNVYDGVITWLFSLKHDISQYESNLLYLSGIGWPILIAIKGIAVLYIVYIYTRMYHRWYSWVRFGMTHLLVLLIFLVLSFCISNTKAYAAPVEDLVPLPAEQRKATFIDNTANLKSVRTISPKSMGIPYIVYYLGFNIGIFLLWSDFERGIKYNGNRTHP